MTPERVTEIYTRLTELVIALDSNPAGRGPAYLQDLISKTRGFLNETAFYLQEAYREKHSFEMNLEAEEAAFEVRSDELLTQDKRVSTLPSIDDRKAMISVILSKERKTIQDLKSQLRNIGHVEKVIRHRHKELENTMSAIRLQRGIVETELRTGAYLGDEGNSTRGNKGLTPTADFDDDEIKQLWDETQQSLNPAQEESLGDDSDLLRLLDPQPVVAKTPVIHKGLDGSPEDPDISKFLDGDDDLSSILDGL